MATVLDYSDGFPGAGAIAAAGHIGAVRYIGFPGRRKCTTAAELADFSRHGIGMALVYEDFNGDWLNGYAGGQSSAQRARNHANAVGFPASRPIYMAVDRDVVTAAQFDVMAAYLAGAGSVLGRGLTGVYGEHDVCARAAGDGVASWFWQCRAWSGTPVRLFPGRHLYQGVGTVRVGGVDCDVSDVLRDDWGQHNHINTFLKEIDPMSVIPFSLPYAADFDNVALPFEVGTSSSVIAQGWVSLLATFGDSNYEVICLKGGQVVPFKSQSAATVGVLKENTRVFFQFPDGAEGLAIRYKNLTPGARLGYSFPQIPK
ncbi:glycoside hydrolase domain-containing protein [Amycolatopsis taiwanensis]|uniref:glycoside hydrolase domain-containing protein n=1 Tax=Amycolatopsis taiwanensis TaxID=342230 RepID=UPI0004B7C901|nr:glycoside hydrolase domain-containing protein [Amycolatopsis taiwanensis]